MQRLWLGEWMAESDLNENVCKEAHETRHLNVENEDAYLNDHVGCFDDLLQLAIK